jgi:hypothetical protein
MKNETLYDVMMTRLKIKVANYELNKIIKENPNLLLDVWRNEGFFYEPTKYILGCDPYNEDSTCKSLFIKYFKNK